MQDGGFDSRRRPDTRLSLPPGLRERMVQFIPTRMTRPKTPIIIIEDQMRNDPLLKQDDSEGFGKVDVFLSGAKAPE